MKRNFSWVLMIHTALIFLLCSGTSRAWQDEATAIKEETVTATSDKGTPPVAAEEVANDDQEEPLDDTHLAIQTLRAPELSGVVAITGSADGKFLYTAAIAGKAICSFEIDGETGELSNKKVQSLIPGAIGIAVSPDQKWMAACASTMKAIALFSRDQETGDLDLVDSYMLDEAKTRGSSYPIAVTFSPDSKYIYGSDSLGVHCLRRTNDSLDVLTYERGEDNCLRGARNLTFDVTGKHLTVACMNANTLVSFKHNPDDGSLELIDYAEDDVEGITTLEGVHGVTACPNSKHIYACGARFEGDNALTAFEIADDGKLKWIQSLEDGEQLEDFEGGNVVKASPDGKYVYATGALSNNIARFKRNASSGKLTFDRYMVVDGEENLGMTSGIHVSGDNRFVYVGGEANGCVYVFQRKPNP